MGTFTDFKKDFYSRVTDFTLFDCDDFNLLKVVLDGLRVNYTKGTTIGQDFLLHPFLFNLKQIGRQIKYQNKSKIIIRKKKLIENRNKFLIGFSERSFSTGSGLKSIYFENIFQVLNRESIIFIGEDKKNNFLNADFKSHELVNVYGRLKISLSERKFRRYLKDTFHSIENSKIFTTKEIEGIKNSFEIFFKDYISWNKILIDLNPKCVLFDQHYHREGFLLACKRHKIKTVEIQHGLIAEQDIFYIFPNSTKNIINKALFADEILVYGEYWKKKLLKGTEYSFNRIKVLGFYHYEPITTISNKELDEFIEGSSIILITTQTNMHELYLSYIKNLHQQLVEKKYPWKIIVKLHPSEDITKYFLIKNLEGCLISALPLNYLFDIAKIHISVYSTTLYDAHRFDIKNFTIPLEPYVDYSKGISSDLIAEELLEDQDPILKYQQCLNRLDPLYNFSIYEILNINILKESLNIK